MAGLATRSGFPRATRIAQCGRPVAVVRDGDWLPSFVHKWCRDRACPACAHQRSRQLGASIRRTLGLREGAALYFVTITALRVPGMPAAASWRRMQTAWDALRHRPEWKGVVGGARIVEAPGTRSSGFHVHYHCIFELERGRATASAPCVACEGSMTVRRKIAGRWRTRPCRTCSSSTHAGDGTMAAGLAAVLRAWAHLTEASPLAQCAVPLDDANAGQLAKYITKMWELDDASARELFAASAGKRILNTFGEWRARGRRGDSPPRAGMLLRGRRYDIHSRRWWLGPLVADIEKLHPRTYVTFEATAACKLEGEPTAARAGKGSWRPSIAVKRLTARQYLRALAADDRRADEHPPPPDGTPTPGADLVRAASGDRGLWSMHARKLQRLHKRTVDATLPPLVVVDEKPPERSSHPWPRAFKFWVRHELEAELASDA